jgi:hypothetical protein
MRLGALIALGAGCTSYQWAVEAALAAGATVDDIVGTLIAVAPISGLARVIFHPRGCHRIGLRHRPGVRGIRGRPEGMTRRLGLRHGAGARTYALTMAGRLRQVHAQGYPTVTDTTVSGGR